MIKNKYLRRLINWCPRESLRRPNIFQSIGRSDKHALSDYKYFFGGIAVLLVLLVPSMWNSLDSNINSVNIQLLEPIKWNYSPTNTSFSVNITCKIYKRGSEEVVIKDPTFTLYVNRINFGSKSIPGGNYQISLGNPIEFSWTFVNYNASDVQTIVDDNWLEVELVCNCKARWGWYSKKIEITDAECIYPVIYPRAARPREESINLYISPGKNRIHLMLTISNVSGPYNVTDFANEPSFINLRVEGACRPEDYSLNNETTLTIYLNNSILNWNSSTGRLIADVIKTKFENLFNVSLNFEENSTNVQIMTFSYSTERSPTIEKIRELFQEYVPSQGFGKIFTPDLIENYAEIMFLLEPNGDLLEWRVVADVYFINFFDKENSQEYNISMIELTGYSEPIQTSPECLESNLYLLIYQVDEDFEIVNIDTVPSEMARRETQFSGYTVFIFEKNVTGSSVEDLSANFEIIPLAKHIDPTLITSVIGIFIGVGIIGFTIKQTHAYGGEATCPREKLEHDLRIKIGKLWCSVLTLVVGFIIFVPEYRLGWRILGWEFGITTGILMLSGFALTKYGAFARLQKWFWRGVAVQITGYLTYVLFPYLFWILFARIIPINFPIFFIIEFFGWNLFILGIALSIHGAFSEPKNEWYWGLVGVAIIGSMNKMNFIRTMYVYDSSSIFRTYLYYVIILLSVLTMIIFDTMRKGHKQGTDLPTHPPLINKARDTLS